MTLREDIAVFIGEERYRDSFYGEYVTEHDRDYCRNLADQILSRVRQEIEGVENGWSDKERRDGFELCRQAILKRLEE